MYTDKKNALQLMALLKEFGISHIVISPGTRNTPISHSIEDDAFFNTYIITDERSAGFFALGLIQKLNKPAAVCCTSGSAMMNYGPAVTEAYYQNLPLLLITADLPNRLLGQAEAQMMPQYGIFDKILKKSVHIPEVETPEDEWLANRLINEALLELDHRFRGPVQINIEFFGNLYNFPNGELPVCRKINRIIDRSNNWEYEYCRELYNWKNILIILGQEIFSDREKQEYLAEFVSVFNCVVITDYLSNFHHDNAIQHMLPVFNTMLYSSQNYKPDIIITMGGNYTFHWHVKGFLQKNTPEKHWHISPRGDLVDKFHCLTDVFEMEEKTFLQKMISASGETGRKNDNSDYINAWKKLYNTYTEPGVTFSDLYVAGSFLSHIPHHCSLHLANSSSVRLAQLFSLDSSIKVFCNRGVDGIDGCVSTAVGYAASCDELVFLLIGDLAFFYDNNGLWNKYKKGNLRILLNNNYGAGLFVQSFGFEVSEFIGAQHSNTAKGYAESLGITYLSAGNKEEFDKSLPEFLTPVSDKPVLLEVFTSISGDAELLTDYYRSNDTSFEGNVKRLIPAGIKNTIRKIIK
jgi:2-succinyl-5-enolpyruvyl-6-hydroxy-3-cyclohexene-1-carboxylate synthase